MVSISSVAGAGLDCTAKDEQEQVGFSGSPVQEADKWVKGRKWNVPAFQDSSCDRVPRQQRRECQERRWWPSGFRRGSNVRADDAWPGAHGQSLRVCESNVSCVGFCCTTWISEKYAYVPSPLSLPPTLLGHHRAPSWAPGVIQIASH